MFSTALKRISVLGILCALPFSTALANDVRVLHSFSGTDGGYPFAPLITDSAGNLYGTTIAGGENDGGTIFKMAPDGTETVLYSFAAGNVSPQGKLIADEGGNLYGTTYDGGNPCPLGSACGTVFKLAPDGTFTVLYSFRGGDDGAFPQSGLIADGDGNFYGTTSVGGGIALPICGNYGCGTIYKLAPDGTETVLYRFSGADGMNPAAELKLDKKGNLYGTTVVGGNLSQSCPNGCGTVFKLSKDGKEKVLHSFCSEPNCTDGSTPFSEVISDKMGNLYGTAFRGGATAYCDYCGLVFKLSASGAETVLYNFCSIPRCADGRGPVAGLIMDKTGNLYGTTTQKGGGNVFKLAPNGTAMVSNFNCKHRVCSRGAEPVGALVTNRKFDRLYGVTFEGGEFNRGVVFSVTP